MLNLLHILNLHTLRISNALESLLEEYIENVMNFDEKTPQVKHHQLTPINLQLLEDHKEEAKEE